MVREWGAKFVVHEWTKALNLASGAALLIATFIFAGPALAQFPDPCPTGQLGTGTGQDIVINRPCTVGMGTYNYGNVNIIAKGSLVFEENVDNEKIDFWAKSILVENGGSLLTHATGLFPPERFGVRGGVLTIHLYGADQGVSGAGITCKSDNCGIPKDFETCDPNDTNKVSLPGGVCDYFYQYEPLPFDDGKDAKGNVGYFGYKVLAVSYGGTLKLFGSKGVSGDLLQPTASGTSWVRLDGTILGTLPGVPGATSLTVRPITWQAGDHIVVTTTDYLPNHSEELLICKIDEINRRMAAKITFTTDLTADPKKCADPGVKYPGVKWTHNGEQSSLYNRLPPRLNISKAKAETRAAVGLLTRTVRIVSEGDTFGAGFPLPPTPSAKGYYFGGHTIVRQGFQSFQVEGVEFRQLGQGGKLGHYPIHFHLARHTPPNTFVRDSSINESMTRWITVHGTQGLTLARNVGYRSIGHGFYLEDAVETDNKFYSNLGIFARAAVANDDNPRYVPGILASPNEPNKLGPNAELQLKFTSDKANPTVFWITNGWNDFQGNMAAGAGMCGVCFWQVPAGIGGGSQKEQWESYASEQACPGDAKTCLRAGTTPIMTFNNNYCTTAMTSFQDVGYTQDCPGTHSRPDEPNPIAPPVLNVNAPRSDASAGECGPNGSNKNWPLCPSDYYPKVYDGEVNQGTKCPPSGECKPCPDPIKGCKPDEIKFCNNSDETLGGQDNCMATVINDYTTSFNWSEYNFAAIWLRKRWHLVSNSFISDIQNAGLTFISGGDYSHSSAIKGLWELVLQTVFVGQTQPEDNDHAFASSTLNWLMNKCDNTIGLSLYCIQKNNSFTLGGFTGFAVSQHMFNIYDGPGDEDSNAYLDIKKRDTGAKAPPLYTFIPVGVPKSANSNTDNKIPLGHCYTQNAAIAWKQPNGFYYPPTFHSNNLFFDNIDIRHYVIVPQFKPNTYVTDRDQVATRYCIPDNDGLRDLAFNNYTGIDRQTILTDDDGSLTGYAKTTSVSVDPFFKTPIEGIECQTDDSAKEGGTAITSPYANVSTVVYPDCAKFGVSNCNETDWNSECTNPRCFGVPLYRLYQTGSEHPGATPTKIPEFIRMAGSNTFQRQTMTVNHGHYYVDLAASSATQSKFGNLPNVFIRGQTYDFFYVFATPQTEQTYKMFVGAGLDPATVTKGVNPIRVNIKTFPLVITADNTKSALTPPPAYDSGSGILTVTLNLSPFQSDYDSARMDHCVPKTLCHWDTQAKMCKGNGDVFPLTGTELNTTCSYAGKDIDCPTGGCVGFSVTLPAGFVAQDQTTANNSALVTSLAECFPKDANWNVTPRAAPSSLAGTCVGNNAPINMNFCTAAPLARFPAPQQR